MEDRREKGILVIPLEEVDEEVEEFKALFASAGGETRGIVRQNIRSPGSPSFLGKGKFEELKSMIKEDIDVVLFDTFLKPFQYAFISENLNVKVLDRAGLILDIFSQRAKSEMTKLQVELAQLVYLLPRLRGKGFELSRLGGGIGTRGPGEKKLETDRRRIRERIRVIKRKLEEVRKTRELHREARKKRSIPVVSLVGYTNAGKTTLFNALTKENRDTGNKLFLTLDAKFSATGREFIIMDTVGFIKTLPPFLIKAFALTLEEIKDSFLILKVVDSSDSRMGEKLEVIDNVLMEISAEKIPSLIVLNKSDLLTDEKKIQLSWKMRNREEYIFVSAIRGEGLTELRKRIKEKLCKNFVVEKEFYC